MAHHTPDCQELVGILNGRHPMSGHVPEWRWVVQALLHHLPG